MSMPLFAAAKQRERPAVTLCDELAAILGGALAPLSNDSRRIMPGSVFAAYPGGISDGRAFIPQALAAGARAVIWQPDGFGWRDEWRVPNAPVARLSQRLAELADCAFDHPSTRLWMIGVTGTNGKTSCTYWLAQLFNRLGVRAALLGTLGNGFPEALTPARNTTPDSIELQSSLAALLSAGAQAVAMEVSSHGLDQRRVDHVAFDFAVFTNLTRDHLDYHGSMEAYAAAKARLFDWPGLRYAIINADDAFGAELLARASASGVETITYGRNAADVRASAVSLTARGLKFDVSSRWGDFTLEAPVLGEFNVDNLLAVSAVLLTAGYAASDIAAATRELAAVPGRMQLITQPGAPSVVIDYAHTPDALAKALQSLRALSPKKLICVFGCGGDRDRGKRALMGEAATRLADHVVITNDNPRSEAPEHIIDEILAGAVRANYEVLPDRGAAIRAAVCAAQNDDIVLVAGKGHENYQEIAGKRLPFDDADAARRALQAWGPPC